jgi:competence ComEA-like helix-hairpin-helix protein
MMLLIWNTAATAYRSFQPGPACPPFSPGISLEELPTDPAGSSQPAGINPRTGPLSIRQKYLIGKRIDINSASIEEINEMPGISDALAAAIVAERTRLGGFRAPDDLLRVKGIKEKRLKKILPFLVEMENN